ncbi:uncharacterized protein N7473_008270 [Penicillium subrubescens]|uniref:uncharacterized protein n=1 Tax=Penicillium subrubescens TaxID=1316194 RepID=UPI0025451C0A|nr:uncharacterized protein N7473_008270 [Penicillium subrubescens]KAJ5892042.1 hypothetical protein N7473_008270 [Penicillium subrubescens]
MCDVPFFPIFPICFQCGTDQNPCHCKVVGPTLGREYDLSPLNTPLSFPRSEDRANKGKITSVLGYPVKLNGKVSNAIPF